jgi:hypothetical protein
MSMNLKFREVSCIFPFSWSTLLHYTIPPNLLCCFPRTIQSHHLYILHDPVLKFPIESPSLVLVINDTKLLMPCVKCFKLGISNTCDEGVRGKE